MKHYKLTVTSMTCHHLYITTPDDVNKDKVYEHWRNFDGGDFSLDQDGDWEFSDLYEVDKEEDEVNWLFPKDDEEEVEDDDFPYEDYEPSDLEMMSSFGTKWHDGL